MTTETLGNILDRMPAEQRDCEQHGTYMARQFRGSWGRCPGCREIEDAADREKQRKLEESERIDAWVRDSGIPKRFLDCSLETYRVENEGQQKAHAFALELAAALAEKAEKGRCAIFCGQPGTGKTHLACSIGRAAIHARRFAVFTTAIRLVRRIKETWRRDSDESESEAIAVFTDPPLLIVDEIGVQFGSDTEKLLLFDVLNERYEQRKSVILVSNLSIDGVKDFLGERVFDRLREDNGAYLPFAWESYRGK